MAHEMRHANLRVSEGIRDAPLGVEYPFWGDRPPPLVLVLRPDEVPTPERPVRTLIEVEPLLPISPKEDDSIHVLRRI
jgi:hypothetical protein